MKRGFVLLAIVCSICFIWLVSADNNRMTLEANIMPSVSNESIVSIEVPNYLFFGNITKGQKSNETKITVNNTGTVDVTVTPHLLDSTEKIFNYTYFRLRKTSGGNEVPFTKIGQFNFNISKSDNEYFYISLDLTGYPEDIPQAIPDHSTDILFVALPQ